MKKIKDGFMFTIGAWIALHVIGFVDGRLWLFGLGPKACSCSEKHASECDCDTCSCCEKCTEEVSYGTADA